MMTTTSPEYSNTSTMVQRRTEAPPKYDMRLNPVYQIDFLNAASGKRLSVTKRRVRFRFGFSNADALAQGLTGVECRGEEHEVTLVWSLTSGKRTVMADGQQVHFSKVKAVTDGRFETSWTMAGHHVIKLIAHAAPPLFNNNSNNNGSSSSFRQYDLQLDGFSFFDMPRIFELGVSTTTMATSVPRHYVEPSHDHHHHRGGGGPQDLHEEQSYMEEYSGSRNSRATYGARRSMPNMPTSGDEYSEHTPSFAASPDGSYYDRNRHPSMPSLPQRQYDERSFASSSAARVQDHQQQQQPPSPAFSTPAPVTVDLINESSPASDFLDTATVMSAPAMYSSPPTDEFAPKVVAPEPPSFASVSQQILQAYGPTATSTNGVLALAYESHTHGIPQQQQQQAPVAVTPPPYHQTPPQQAYGGPYQPQPPQQQYYQPQQQQQTASYYQTPSSPEYKHQMVSPDASYHASPVSVMSPTERPPLVHIMPTMMKPLNLVEEEDRARPQLTELERAMKNLVNLDDISEPLETPEQIKAKQRHQDKKPQQSKPLPPKEPEWHLGLTPPLADIQKHKKPRAPPTKEVMRTHAFDPAAAQAGMMVVYGQATGPLSPQASLPTPSGFGAGFHAGQQQQQQAQYYHPHAAAAAGYYPHGGGMTYAATPSPVANGTPPTMAPPMFAAY